MMPEPVISEKCAELERATEFGHGQAFRFTRLLPSPSPDFNSIPHQLERPRPGQSHSDSRRVLASHGTQESTWTAAESYRRRRHISRNARRTEPEWSPGTASEPDRGQFEVVLPGRRWRCRLNRTALVREAIRRYPAAPVIRGATSTRCRQPFVRYMAFLTGGLNFRSSAIGSHRFPRNCRHG